MASISSLGIASGTLTQDVIDQLKSADETNYITPLTTKITLATNQVTAMGEIDTWMSDLASAAFDLQDKLLYTERSATVTGEGISVSADANTDIQSFSFDVVNLAKKTIVESGAFTSKTDPIASTSGTLTLSIGGTDYAIDYDTSTTLDDLKKKINTIAGDDVGASIVQFGTDDFRLFLTSKETGAAQTISLSDSGGLSGTQLDSGLSTVQDGVDATFQFNGQTLTRSSNVISDLITGVTITMQSEGTSAEVDITQNRDLLFEKLSTFVEKYNTAVEGLAKKTHNSPTASERGIFASDGTIRSMLRDVRNMMLDTDNGVSVIDFGLTMDKDGVLTLDEDTFNTQMDTSSSNVESFFAGGSYTKSDGSTITLDGFFNTFNDQIEEYTQYNGLLDSYLEAIKNRKSDLEDAKTKMTERIESKYETMAKQWASYDAIISKLNQQSSYLTQLIDAASSSSSSSSSS